MVAGAVAVVVNHVEDVALGPLVRDRAGVVWAVDIKVVVDADIDVVVTPVKPGEGERREGNVNISGALSCRKTTTQRKNTVVL